MTVATKTRQAHPKSYLQDEDGGAFQSEDGEPIEDESSQ